VTGSGPIVQPDAQVLFVCLGNICRSPTAEGVFRSVVERVGLAARVRIDSAGTGDWHVGRPPDRRAVAAARERGYELGHLRARQVRRSDFAEFDWILAMDRSNLAALRSLRPRAYGGHLGLFLELAPDLGVAEVPDPYGGGAPDFTRVLDLVEHASASLLTRLQARLARPG
jgi:protein-tyrosine phosphatase